MIGLEKNYNAKIEQAVKLIQLISLLFCALVISNSLFIYRNKLTDSISVHFNGDISIELSLFVILLYLFCLFSFVASLNKNRKQIAMIENTAFMLIFSILMIFEKSYVYEYKQLFILIIISVTLQCGIKKGLLISIISSIAIFAIDLTFKSNYGMRTPLMDDMILTSIYFSIVFAISICIKFYEEKVINKKFNIKQLNTQLLGQNSKYKDMEEAFIGNQECCAFLIENSRDAIFLHIPDRIIFANESALKILGIEEEEIKDRKVQNFIHVKERDNALKYFTEIINKKDRNVRFQSKLVNKNGEIIDVENISSYINYGNNEAIITIIQDISYEKEIEKLKINVRDNFELLNKTIRLNNSITQLFVNMTHEFKTPVNVIFSALQLLMVNCKKEDKNIEYFNIMKQNCYRLMKLINNFFMLTRLDAGMIKANLKNQDIIKRIEDVTICVAEYNKGRNVNITFDTEVEEKIVAFDSEFITKVMLSILSNAVKYCGENGKIFVDVWCEDKHVYIAVKDNGMGIPEERLQFVFERFCQLDKTLSRKFEGTGVGLNIAKSLIELHKGAIEVESQYGVGSKFTIMLPNKVIQEKKQYIEVENFQTDKEKTAIEFSDIY